MNPNRRQLRAALLVVALLLICNQARAGLQEPDNENSVGMTAEQYVLQQVEAGKPAKVAEVFKEDKNRVISAAFLKDLLTNSQNLHVHPHGIMIEGATIDGELDLINDDIPYDTLLTACQFQGEVNITQSRFAKSLIITDSIFMAKSDFESAIITFDFNAERADFKDEAYFKSMRVEGDMSISETQFAAEANFSGVEVNGNLHADGTQFNNTADFNNLKVKGDAVFRRDRFAAYIDFSEARLTNFFLTDSTLPNSQTDLSRMTIDNAFLENTHFNKVRIDNMTFQYLSPASWHELQDFANHSDYNPQFYSALEALFERHGYRDEANEVFIAHKQRERHERLSGLEWFGNFMADYLVGYGKRLKMLLLWSAVFVIVGYFVFRNEKGMETLKPDDRARYADTYNGFWYSLDLFLPILSLGDKSIWTPRSDRKFAILYKRFHIILGYLFVPIGLAALSGIIK